jgi:transcriptional regulator with XRE-family HTH domain
MKIHEGKNVRRIREILDLKQDAFAELLGKDWNQQKISLLEGKEVIDPVTLSEISRVLGIKREAIRKFNNEDAIAYINSYDNDNINNKLDTACRLSNCTFNPLDKLIEVLLLENKKKDELIQKLLMERKIK